MEKAAIIAKHYPGTKTYYLAANFPFVDGFPLIPHLSHNDGKKLDLTFYYQSIETKEYVTASPSWIGYGAYESPKPKEVNWPKRCEEQDYWQYGAIQVLAPFTSNRRYEVEVVRTRMLLQEMEKTESIQKIFLEPHLVERWKLSALNKIRFHGCHAVRHDDHIHLQIR
ncbi:MAG: hypothetical protein RIG62_02755 [Cyclobacteriaceae bacterium]